MLAKVTRGLVIVSIPAVLAACNAGNPGAGLGTAQPDASQPAAQAVVQGICPSVSLRDGTNFFRTYTSGKNGDPQSVIHQASLAEVTRSCSRDETSLSINVMVQGRLTAGPQGKAGNVRMPIRVAVVEGEKVIYSELTQFDSAIVDPVQPAQFVFTKQVTGLPGDLSRLAQVYVGFDEGPKKK